MKRFLFLSLLLILGPASKSTAQTDSHPSISHSGTEFLEVCKYVDGEYDPRHAYNDAQCMGWVQGFLQGIYVSDEFQHTPLEKGMTCPPDQLSNIQLFRIIKKYIDEHPERAHMFTRYLASESLVVAFPCKK